MNIGLLLQITGVLVGVSVFGLGLLMSHQQNTPTIFSYVSHFIKTFKQEDYFERRQSGIYDTGLIYNGATQQVTNGLIEVGKMLKTGNITEAEKILQGIPKNNLTPTDVTNIQSTTAGIELAKGNIEAAETIYKSIIATGTNSNAVFSGMAAIAAFKTLNLHKTDPSKAIALLHESNEWYLKALAGDQRPQVLVHVYYGLYDNYERLTNYFKQNEHQNLEKYRKLFLETNQKAGDPYQIPEKN